MLGVCVSVCMLGVCGECVCEYETNNIRPKIKIKTKIKFKIDENRYESTRTIRLDGFAYLRLNTDLVDNGNNWNNFANFVNTMHSS